MAEPGLTPRYSFDRTQIAAIRSSLAAPASQRGGESAIALTLTAFNCIACHVRNDYGGVANPRNLLFTTSEPSLGDEARIPPQLTQVGAKLRGDWMRSVLFDGATVRPYMHTRMPQYGEDNLKHLVPLFAATDGITPHEFRPPPQKQKGEVRDAARKLVGDEALNCITCHNFNGKESPGFKGMDLMTSFERLQPSWFYQFMVDPSSVRPGITMPNFWEDPEAVYDEILNGEREAQIEAIWYYLSLGRSAPDPSGIRRVSTKLTVEGTTRTYRGRSRVAGYRGIAVGFPGGLNYAFNANTGSLSAVWTGDYVSVNWSGQGAGGFNPAGRVVDLPQDVSFLRLASPDDAWPLRPQTTKEQPINPDPTYPRNHGYRFRGYYFDDAWIPTFMYSSGGVEIEDRSIADLSGDKPASVRTVQFTSEQPETLWFRLLTGPIESQHSAHQFAVDELTVTIPKLAASLRESQTSDGEELLCEIALPKGSFTMTVRYELR